ncbi:hypothetical protein [Candidatus Williamhamiltonella defendens]|uniref:hypothetical protein n=1 Tax=Candidatus Williamhamiltonella defendens TaxID=138072 RepID=UPI001F443F84|nr:hypothetical protein [Candidatus Hamiltonella defensa]
MSNIEKIVRQAQNTGHSSSVLPAQLLIFWEYSQDLWGVKDINLKYIYVNAAYYNIFNINPKVFCIAGHLDNALPSQIAGFASLFHQHNRQNEAQESSLLH